MEMEALEKSLKASFVGAANQLTQLYTNSISYQKQAYVHGYNKSTRDLMEWVLKQSNSRSKSISVDALLHLLRERLEDSPTSQEESYIKRSGTGTRQPEPDNSATFFNTTAFNVSSIHGNNRTNSATQTFGMDENSSRHTYDFTSFGTQQQTTIQQTIPNDNSEQRNVIFNFLAPTMSQSIPFELPPLVNTESKKRQLEHSPNSMDVYYPPDNKKTKVIS